MALTTTTPLPAVLSCLAGALLGLLLFVLTHTLLRACFPSLQLQRQERREREMARREAWAAEMEEWARADADALAPAPAPAQELEPDTDADLDLGEVIPIEEVLETGIGIDRAEQHAVWLGAMDVGMAVADEVEGMQREILEMVGEGQEIVAGELLRIGLEVERERRHQEMPRWI